MSTSEKLTYREAKVLQALTLGHSQASALRFAGFPEWTQSHPERIITPEIWAEFERLRSQLVEHTISAGLIDAQEIHEYLTDAIRADWCDIENDDGTFRPISEWPLIWRQMKEAGDVEVEFEAHRSHDGEDAQGLGGWDRDGMVRKVKVKFASRIKLIELAMKHKGVDAMVKEQKGDVHLHVHAEVTQRLNSALAREKRLIDVQAKEVQE